MSTDVQFYARFDAVRGEEWDSLEYLQSAEDLAELDRFWSEDPGYSEDEKHSAFRAIVDRKATDFGSLREWVVHLRALILVGQISPRAADEYLESEAWGDFTWDLSRLRTDVYGDDMSGAAGRRAMQLLDSGILDIPLAELEAGDTRNVRDIFMNLELLGDEIDSSPLMRQVTLKVDGVPSTSSEFNASVSKFCREAADVYTWIYLLDLREPGALEIIAAYWEGTAAKRDEEDDDDANDSIPSLADRVDVVMEQALLEEYDVYASRYGLGLEGWEDWCQEVLDTLRKLQLNSRSTARQDN